ncbi:MAG: glycosyltransferase [bacterium]
MYISIIIRTKNERALIRETLDGILRQDFDGEYEIIIIDSGSTDGTVELTKKYPVRLVQMPEGSFTYGRALNLGAEMAHGEIMVNLSAHTLPSNTQWLAHLTFGFSDPEVAAIYGKQISIKEKNPYEARQFEKFFGNKDIKFKKTTHDVKKIHFSNANCALRKSIWKRFKFHDLLPGSEDILWQRQVLNAGYSIIYKANAVVYHHHELNFSRLKTIIGHSYALSYINNKYNSKYYFIYALYDIAVYIYLTPIDIIQNLIYLFNNKLYRYIMLCPVHCLCASLFSVTGRIRYRTDKDFKSIKKNLMIED